MIRKAKLLFWKRGSTPVYLTHFVTNRCNAKCKHCFFWKEINKNINEELSLEEIKTFQKTLGKNLYNVLLTGGEPFLRKDFYEIIRGYAKNTTAKSIQIPTNGLLTKKIEEIMSKVLTEFKKINFGIILSLDELNEKHDKIRGVPDLFKNTIQSYRTLQKLEAKHNNFNLNINITVSKHNQDSLKEIYYFCRDNLKAKNIFFGLTRGDPLEEESKKIDICKYEELARIVSRDQITGKLKGYSKFLFCDLVNAENIVSRKIVARLVKENKYILPCYAGLLSAVIYSNGDVYPCEMLDRRIGNLRDYNYNFKELWNSGNAKTIRKFIKDSKCFCTHECCLTVNLIFNAKQLAKVLKEWILMQKK